MICPPGAASSRTSTERLARTAVQGGSEAGGAAPRHDDISHKGLLSFEKAAPGDPEPLSFPDVPIRLSAPAAARGRELGIKARSAYFPGPVLLREPLDGAQSGDALPWTTRVGA